VYAGCLASTHCTAYTSPEVLLSAEEHQALQATPAADIWAAGVMLYEAFSGMRLAESWQCSHAVLTANGSEPYPWLQPEQSSKWLAVPAKARSTTLACLCTDPDDRPIASELVQILDGLADDPQSFSRNTFGRGGFSECGLDTPGAVAANSPVPKEETEWLEISESSSVALTVQTAHRHLLDR
jgi:serine/threonine protein kinase